MTEPNLLDRMMESTSWTRTETVDPAADLARGRRRLRVRRTRIGAAAVSAVAVTALGVNVLTGSTGTSPAPPVASGTPATVVVPKHCAGAHPVDDKGSPVPWKDDAARLLASLTRHVDPQERHVVSPADDVRGGCTGGYNRSVKGPWVEVATAWRQDGDEGRVRIEIRPPGIYGDPDLGPSYAHPQLSACRKPPSPAATPSDCRWTTSEDGKRVLVITSDLKGFKSYLARYVRPDGQLIVARVESGVHNDPDTPQPSKPVRNPAVTTEQLVAAVTDPEMTLR